MQTLYKCEYCTFTSHKQRDIVEHEKHCHNNKIMSLEGKHVVIDERFLPDIARYNFEGIQDIVYDDVHSDSDRMEKLIISTIQNSKNTLLVDSVDDFDERLICNIEFTIPVKVVAELYIPVGYVVPDSNELI